jgi:gamma-glutamyltranspeptidase/glutathione hydrolase
MIDRPIGLALSGLLLVFPVGLQAQQPPERARALPTPEGKELPWSAEGTKGAVVAGGSESVSAGIEILNRGGNAADAAAATILALCVTDASAVCFGGEVPILVFDKYRGVVEVIAAQGAAPRLATLDHFAGRERMPTTGIEPAAVPAVLDACVTLLDRYGTLSFQATAEPTLRLLDRNTFPWHADLARTLRRLIDAENSAGERRSGLRAVSDTFYRGEIAREIDAWSRANGGLLRYSDMATHTTRIESPVTINYRGFDVYKCGPWTQGPALLQTLQLIERFQLDGSEASMSQNVHLLTESLKLALADRDTYYADPLYAQVPLAELLRPEYASRRRALIDPERASTTLIPGDPIHGLARRDVDPPRHTSTTRPDDTTTCIVSDAAGNVVAATPSGWSGVLAGSTGVWLGTRLQSFRVEPDHPNALEPGKRPRITLTPTLVLKDGQPTIAVSVAGGDLQDQVTLQLLVDLIDFGMTPADAVRAPRFSTSHHIGSFAQTPPKLASLSANTELGEKTLEELAAKGHQITPARGAIGAPVVLRRDPSTGRVEVAGDPRAGRHAGAN